MHGLVQPTVLRSPADLVEAYARAGMRGQAAATLTSFEARAAAGQSAWASAAVARCRGLLADDEEFEQDFVRALTLHDELPSPFEKARTELCFGERLRRARRRNEARVQLREALARFERLGAQPWAERARSELDASAGPGALHAQGIANLDLEAGELELVVHEASAVHRLDRGADLAVTRREAIDEMGEAIPVGRHGADLDRLAALAERLEIEALATQIQSDVQHSWASSGRGPTGAVSPAGRPPSSWHSFRPNAAAGCSGAAA